MALNCYGYFQQRLTEGNLRLLTEPYGGSPFDSMELVSVADLAYREFWAHYNLQGGNMNGSDAPLLVR